MQRKLVSIQTKDTHLTLTHLPTYVYCLNWLVPVNTDTNHTKCLRYKFKIFPIMDDPEEIVFNVAAKINMTLIIQCLFLSVLFLSNVNCPYEHLYFSSAKN